MSDVKHNALVDWLREEAADLRRECKKNGDHDICIGCMNAPFTEAAANELESAEAEVQRLKVIEGAATNLDEAFSTFTELDPETEEAVAAWETVWNRRLALATTLSDKEDADAD